VRRGGGIFSSPPPYSFHPCPSNPPTSPKGRRGTSLLIFQFPLYTLLIGRRGEEGGGGGGRFLHFSLLLFLKLLPIGSNTLLRVMNIKRRKREKKRSPPGTNCYLLSILSCESRQTLRHASLLVFSRRGKKKRGEKRKKQPLSLCALSRPTTFCLRRGRGEKRGGGGRGKERRRNCLTSFRSDSLDPRELNETRRRKRKREGGKGKRRPPFFQNTRCNAFAGEEKEKGRKGEKIFRRPPLRIR